MIKWLWPFVITAIFTSGQTSHIFAQKSRDIPLIAATLDDDVEKVKHLIHAGAHIDEIDGGKNTALIYAARDGRVEITRILLNAGADPGWVDGELVTPLILASFRNHVEIVKMLLARNVDRQHRDKWNRTALTYALRRGQNDPIALLLKP